MDAINLLAYLLYLVLFNVLFISLVLLLARAMFSCRIRGTKTWRLVKLAKMQTDEKSVEKAEKRSEKNKAAEEKKLKHEVDQGTWPHGGTKKQ